MSVKEADMDKNIYKRLNECYKIKYGEQINDGWFGTDDEKIWEFERPAEGLRVKMIFNAEQKRIDCYRYSDGHYVPDGNYSWR